MPEELSAGEFVNIHEESGYYEEDMWCPSKNFTLKEFPEIFQDIESTKDKILKTDPNLERTLTIYQSIKKVPVPHHNLYVTLFLSFYKEIKCFNS